MRFRTILMATAMIAVTAPAMATGNSYRCENLDPLVTSNPDIISTAFKTSNGHTSTAPKCTFAPAGIRACPDVTTGGSLSVPVTPSEMYQLRTSVPDTITPQYREGELDKKDYAKAVIIANAIEVLKAIKEHRSPNLPVSVSQGPYIDWEAPQTGSCN
jgi:hypothetical protein